MNDSIVMGAMGVQGFMTKTEQVWQLMVSHNWPSVKLATYKFSLRGEP